MKANPNPASGGGRKHARMPAAAGKVSPPAAGADETNRKRSGSGSHERTPFAAGKASPPAGADVKKMRGGSGSGEGKKRRRGGLQADDAELENAFRVVAAGRPYIMEHSVTQARGRFRVFITKLRLLRLTAKPVLGAPYTLKFGCIAGMWKQGAHSSAG